MSSSSLGCSGRSGVVLLESRHEGDQGLDTLDGHGVVEGCTASTDRSVTLQVDQVGCGGLSEELVLKIIVAADSEGDIDARAVSGLHVVHVVALRAVDIVVEEGGPLGSLGLHGRDSALLEHVGEIEAAHIDRPAGWRVVERVGGLGEGLPVAQQGSVAAMAGDQVVSNDDEGESGGADVLLRASVDNAVLRPVDWLRAEVAGHVADEGLASGHLVVSELVELEALDGLVVTVVEELGLSVDIPVGWLGNRCVSVGRVVSDLVSDAVLLRLFDGALRPSARSQVVRSLLLSIAEQVVADGRELERCTTLEHEDSVIVRD